MFEMIEILELLKALGEDVDKVKSAKKEIDENDVKKVLEDFLKEVLGEEKAQEIINAVDEMAENFIDEEDEKNEENEEECSKLSENVKINFRKSGDIFTTLSLRKFDNPKDFVLSAMYLTIGNLEVIKLKPTIHSISDLEELKEEINNNTDPFIVRIADENKEYFYYVKQKKNRLVFHTPYGFHTLKITPFTNVGNIFDFVKNLCVGFNSIDEIIKKFHLNLEEKLNKNKEINFNTRLFLKNLLDDLDESIKFCQISINETEDEIEIQIFTNKPQEVQNYILDYVKALSKDKEINQNLIFRITNNLTDSGSA